MKKTLITLYLLSASLIIKAQAYYAGESGIFTGTTKGYNYNTNKTEKINYNGFFFNMPIGIKNDYNVLFEGSVGYNGYLSTSANVGYQFGYDYLFNMQVLAGVADNIEVERHLKMVHNYSYNAIGRFNIGHFFVSGKYSDKTAYFGLGFKAYIYE